MLILNDQVPHISPPPKARMFWSASKGTYRQHMKQLVRDKKERIRIERLQNCASCYLAKQQISPGGRIIQYCTKRGGNTFARNLKIPSPLWICSQSFSALLEWERFSAEMRTIENRSFPAHQVKQQISPVIKLRNSNFIANPTK